MTPEPMQSSFDDTSGPLAALRREHVELIQATRPLRRKSGSGTGLGPGLHDLRVFSDRIKATGAILSEDGERRAAQDLLDYWSAQLMVLSPSSEAVATLPVIEEYRPSPEPMVGAAVPVEPATAGSAPATPVRPQMAPAPMAPAPPATASVAPPVAAPPRFETTVAAAPRRGRAGAAVAMAPETNPEAALSAIEEALAIPLPPMVAEAPQPVPAPSPAPAVSDTQKASREQVRLSALARQWRNSGKQPGYCLTGRALAEAAEYRRTDPEIAEFIAASERNQTRNHSFLYFAAAVLVSAIAIALYLAWRSSVDQLALTNAELEANKRLRALSEQELQSVRQRIDGAAELKGQLDLATDFLRREVAQGQIRIDSVPEGLRELVRPPSADAYAKAQEQTRVQAEASAANPALAGYQPEFLGTSLALPGLSPEVKAVAFAEGRPLDYVNYSVVFNSARRMAVVTASNVDRRSLLVLPRGVEAFVGDPRVPARDQLTPAVFAENDLDRGHLVTRQEATWGPFFTGGDDLVDSRASANVNVFPNITVQFDNFNRGVWSELERWVLTEHNKSAGRIAVFSGPVFRDDDPVVVRDAMGDVRLPRAFWKIAVSPSADGALVVDAFLIRQSSDAGEKRERVPFIPDLYRVSVADIERLTGLSFDERFRAAKPLPTVQAQPSDAAQIAASVRLLDGSTAQNRTATAQRIVTALRDGGVPDAGQMQIVEALAAMAEPDSFSRLTRTGRYNLVYVLSVVPTANWARPDWAQLTAHMQGIATAIEHAPTTLAEPPEANLRRFLAEWQRRMAAAKP
ncbi:DNA/RNA non-specific endonuclease [Bosea sp. BK604]|uniref:DNA/RNA non-specific endonuclease n=1 Tax=Bosea sp. BK604 TaxID=2512180 RepID=UPI001404A896|nr:DNA/RNA non-specific endonuclease [Bosea sp. BK604]